MLKERWRKLSEDENEVWKKWERWETKRYNRDVAIYEKRQASLTKVDDLREADSKKRKDSDSNAPPDLNSKSSFHIPKKKRS